MEVYEDKDYDTEEIKFWNFMSKNKGIKPIIIRTVVYKFHGHSMLLKNVKLLLSKQIKIKKMSHHQYEHEEIR